MARSSVHLLLKYARVLQGHDTITEHRNVLAKHGEVWYGKFGSVVAQTHIDRINKQIAEGIPSILYLVAGARGKYEVFIANVILLQRDAPVNQKRLVPAYYVAEAEGNRIGLWAKLNSIEPAPDDTLKNLTVISSGLNAADSISRSMSGKFLVH